MTAQRAGSVIKAGALRYYLRSVGTLCSLRRFYLVPLKAACAWLSGRPFDVELHSGLRFRVESLLDVWIIKEVVLDGDYERFRRIRDADVVIDIGAGLGEFCIHVAERASRVYAVEADPGRCRLLETNLELNNVKNVTVVPARADSLDRLLSDLGIEGCDFLKIDCEGCEYALLGPGQNAHQRIGYIAMEVHRFNDEQRRQYSALLALLRTRGMEPVEQPNPVHESTGFVFVGNPAGRQ